MKKHNIRSIKKQKKEEKLSMLTCYDYQTAQLLNETKLDLILVGDSLGNVVLGFDNTVSVTLEHMITFSSAVRRGAPDKFVITDLPFGTYFNTEIALKSAIELTQRTNTDAIKIEGGSTEKAEIINQCVDNGIAVMGHIGLQPQSVSSQGGYYTHGKTEESSKRLLEEAKRLEAAGAFSIVLECVNAELAKEISQKLNIPTIGIGSGSDVDGQVLVTNDLLGMGQEAPPSFCKPVADFYSLKQTSITQYIESIK